MKKSIKTRWLVCGCFCIFNFAFCISATAFEGRINAVMTRGSQSDSLLYTAGTNFLRVEMTATNWPNPVDILDRNSGELTLLFPNNRSFVRLKQGSATVPVAPVGVPPTGLGEPGADPRSSFNSPGDVSGQRPQTAGETPALPMPPGVGLQSAPGTPAMPAMPPRPVMPNLPPGVGPQPVPFGETPNGAGGMPALRHADAHDAGNEQKLELQATGQKTNLLGFACEQYELKQRGETMEIWATDQLFPFQPYVQNQPHRFGPRMIEEQWPELVKAKKLFPLLATLKFDNGAERFRFEVQSVTPEKLTAGDEQLFQPPAN